MTAVLATLEETKLTSGPTRRIARAAIGSLVGGIALAGLVAPTASADTDCSPAAVDSSVATVTQQARAYLNANPSADKVLMTAALQRRQQAAQTIAAYADSNPQQYADFKAILSPLSTLQNQCGVSVVPAEYQWAFSQFIG
jgi:hemophore-related protein